MLQEDMVGTENNPEEKLTLELIKLRREVSRLREQKRTAPSFEGLSRTWRAVLDAINDPVCVVSLEGTVLRCNKAMTHLLNKGYPEIVEKDFDQLIFGSFAVPQEFFDEMIATGKREVLYTSIGDRLYHISIDPYYDESKKPAGFIYLMKEVQKEIYERLFAEADLRDQLVFLQKLIDTIPYPIFYQDKAGLYQGCNLAFEKFFSRTKEEIREKSVEDIFPSCVEVDHEADLALHGQLGIQVYEVCLPDEQGRCRSLLFNKAAFANSDGTIAGLVGVIIDVTERRQMEQEMARFDRLNLAGEMAASIAHEIRNPLTTVRGFLQLFKESKDPLKEHIDLMIEEIDRINVIVTEFLSLTNNKIIHLKEHNLNMVVLGVYPLLAADALMADKQIRLDLKPLPSLLLDESEIRQMILNLSRNGLQAMAAGGILSISTFLEEGEPVLSVQDEGPGIDPAILDKIGTPFYSTRDNGIGLGLAVCYRIALRHHASIDFQTGPGGTTFFVRFKA